METTTKPEMTQKELLIEADLKRLDMLIGKVMPAAKRLDAKDAAGREAFTEGVFAADPNRDYLAGKMSGYGSVMDFLGY